MSTTEAIEELEPKRPASKASTIGAVCKALSAEFPDISISKIRYLEDQRLLTPRRTPGGYRLYSAGDVSRLRTILRRRNKLRANPDAGDAANVQPHRAVQVRGQRRHSHLLGIRSRTTPEQRLLPSRHRGVQVGLLLHIAGAFHRRLHPLVHQRSRRIGR